MAKPTSFSVTSKPCTCGFLECQADDPDSPIVFDARLNEYHFEYASPCSDVGCDSAKAQMMIYHCPFCGGAALLTAVQSGGGGRPNLVALGG